MPPDRAAMIEEEVIAAERNAPFRVAFNELPPTCYELLSMLISDPPRAYTEMSERLGIAVGSIGRMRARCLDRLRRSPHLNALLAPRPGRSRSRILGSEDRG
jgi:DNA-directed RNA polymerase specialized sigma24 family protein